MQIIHQVMISIFTIQTIAYKLCKDNFIVFIKKKSKKSKQTSKYFFMQWCVFQVILVASTSKTLFFYHAQHIHFPTRNCWGKNEILSLYSSFFVFLFYIYEKRPNYIYLTKLFRELR